MNLFFPGTFRPFHNGHLEIAKRAYALLPEDDSTLFIGIASNPDKPEDDGSRYHRMQVIKEVCLQNKLYKVDVITYDCATAIWAKLQYANIVRGLRNASDFEYEKPMATVNKTFGVETIFIITENEFCHVSSSLIKKMMHANLPIDAYLPSLIVQYIKENLEKK